MSRSTMPRWPAALTPRVVAGRTFGAAVKLVRASGLLPKAIPDGRGDEAVIAKTPIDAQVIVYFADTVTGLYQLRPWFQPLRELHRVHPVVVLGTDSRAIAAIRRESGLTAYTVAHYSSVDLILQKAPARLALYVNHNAANFSMLAFPQLVHVSIMHGDSDKAVSISGQTKAYDFTFVAGQAAVDRLAAFLPLYDSVARCVKIGRPQVSATAVRDPRAETVAGGARLTVLYAPTWEGDTASLGYSSLAASGVTITRSVLGDQRFRLVYRPHPLTGRRLSAFAEADARVRALVTAAARAEGGAGHRVSLGGPAARDLLAADLLVADVSSLAIDFLATGRPLTVTIPPDAEALVAATPLLEVAPRLGFAELEDVAGFLGELWDADRGTEERLALARYYLGDTTPGAATKAFIDACGRMIDLAERNWAEVRRAMAAGAPPRTRPEG
ncbi:MAG: CDP-glycerol glycerophosphotransferase family protein [Bifidobacteriaceae bacterium]|jgi:hypothetical protein|nr:CDP-glycerol glycerophosphotransferase family protein [Bifidobacteriaceae bacterium]